jgi:NADH dehydrogenase
MERNPERASQYAKNLLEKKGVHILLGEKVLSLKDNELKTQSGKKIQAELVFACTGIAPNFEFLTTEFHDILNEKRFIKVNAHQQVAGQDHIFAAGDIADIGEEKTAQNAKRQAKIVIENIQRKEKGKELLSYVSKKTPMVISLGKWKGILVRNNKVTTGIFPAILKRIIEKMEMRKYR